MYCLHCESGEALGPHAHKRLNTFFNILQIFIITTADGPDIVILTLGIFNFPTRILRALNKCFSSECLVRCFLFGSILQASLHRCGLAGLRHLWR